MGNDNSATKNKSRSIAIVAAAVLIVIAAFFLISNFVNIDSSDEALTPELVQGSTLQGEEGRVENDENLPATTTKKSDIGQGSIVDENSNDEQPTSASVVYVKPKEEDKVVVGSTASKILKGAKTAQSWSASSVISNVLVEKVSVSLPVYEDGVKTNEKETRNIFIAEITTRPSRLSYIASSQFTNSKISDITSFVRGFENKTGQDVLFASTHEMCSRDFENPMTNVFYNGDDSLTATVIKNGVIAQRGDASKTSLVIYNDGRWEYPVNVSMSSAEELIKNGAVTSVSYTYPIIWNGEKYKHPDTGYNTGIWTNHSLDESTNSTLIGKKGNDKYYVLISQGCGSGYLAEYMLNDLGVEYAYWGNGGLSAAMYVKGYGIITPDDYIVHGDLFCVR